LYQVQLSAAASDQLKRLDKPTAHRILTQLKWLAEHFGEIEPEALSAAWQDHFKLRVGSYHVIYTADRSALAITVHLVGHRREIYKRPGG
jgi:mRNA interferase RelE/StbE